MWEIKSNCQRIATIEALLLTTGMAVPDNPINIGEPVPLYHKQREFKSNVFHRKYQITTDRRLRPFCKWIDVVFRYDLIGDRASIQFKQDGREKLQELIESGFKLLEQTQPAEAERIKELRPFEIIQDTGNNPKLEENKLDT